MVGDARSHSSAPDIHRCALGGGILAIGFLLAGCVGGGSSPSPTAPPSVAPSPTLAPPAPLAAPTASPSSGATGCVSLNLDYGQDARGKAGDPVDLARNAVAGLRAGDVVERGEAAGSVRIVRAGEIVGNVAYVSDGAGGWLLVGGTLCDGFSVRS